jgi:hypothetical protein
MSRINILCSIPNFVFENANLKPNAFDLAFVNVTKGLFDSTVDIGKLLIATMELFDNNLIDKDRFIYTSKILFPQLPLYRCILSNLEDEFNEKLLEAVLYHKEFWGSKKLEEDSEGWISLPMIAACVVAHDNKDFNITVETDYIPMWLVKKEF